jgi:hypothetical protein
MAERGRGYYGDIPPDDEFFTDDSDLDHRDITQFDVFMETLIPVEERKLPEDQKQIDCGKRNKVNRTHQNNKSINWGNEGNLIDDQYGDDDDDDGGIRVREKVPVPRK